MIIEVMQYNKRILLLPIEGLLLVSVAFWDC
jgi:hypothetical protein